MTLETASDTPTRMSRPTGTYSTKGTQAGLDCKGTGDGTHLYCFAITENSTAIRTSVAIPTRPIIRFIIQTSSLVAPASLLTICVLKPLIKGAHYTNYGATK